MERLVAGMPCRSGDFGKTGSSRLLSADWPPGLFGLCNRSVARYRPPGRSAWVFQNIAGGTGSVTTRISARASSDLLQQWFLQRSERIQSVCPARRRPGDIGARQPTPGDWCTCGQDCKSKRDGTDHGQRAASSLVPERVSRDGYGSSPVCFAGPACPRLARDEVVQAA